MISDISIRGRGKEEVRSGGYGLDAQEGREPSLLPGTCARRRRPRRRRSDRRHLMIHRDGLTRVLQCQLLVQASESYGKYGSVGNGRSHGKGHGCGKIQMVSFLVQPPGSGSLQVPVALEISK